MIMEECNFNQSMTVEDFGGWLSEKGFSDKIRKRFEGKSSRFSAYMYASMQ